MQEWTEAAATKARPRAAIRARGCGLPAPQTPLAEAKRIYWFESAYDAMAYYQLNQKWDKELRKGVFVSTGGAPSQQQFKAMIKATPRAYHHLCFDQDRAGQIFAINFALTQAGKTFTSNVTKDDKTAGPYQWRGEPELRNKTRTLSTFTG